MAQHPGIWSVPPTAVREACRPERVRLGQGAKLTVLAPGLPGIDVYAMNCGERFELAGKLFDENALDAA